MKIGMMVEKIVIAIVKDKPGGSPLCLPQSLPQWVEHQPIDCHERLEGRRFGLAEEW